MRLPSFKLADASPFGPIFGKELRVTARRKRNHLLRVAYLGMLLLFLLMVYTGNSNSSNVGGVAYRIQQQNELGQEFFAMFSMFCVIAMGLIGPVLTSTAVSSERLGKTLPVLLMTPINSWQIVSGKLFSRLLIALMLIGLSLPVLAVVRLLGGVEVWQMIAVICICTVFALSCAAIGLFLSTLLNRAYAVILFSYAVVLLLYLFAPMLAMLTLFRSANQSIVLWWMCLFNPVMDTAFLSIPNGPLARVPWWPGVLVQLGLAATLLIASALIVRRFERQRGERPMLQPAPVAAPSPPTLDTEAPLPTSRQFERPTSDQPVGDNPVLWRETRRPLFSGRWRALSGIVIIGLLLASYLCFASAKIIDENEAQIPYALGFHGLYWLLIAVLSATAIAQEKESDTWTVLLVAPLHARDIVLGKLIGIARKMLWPTLLVTLHFCAFAVANVISWTACFVVIWVLITFNTVWAATGLYLSLRLAKVTTAVIVNLLVPVALFVAMPLIFQVTGQMFVGHSADWGQAPAIYIPYMYDVQVLDRVTPEFGAGRSLWLPMFGHEVPLEQFIFVLFVVGIAHITAAAAVIGHTIYHFDTIVGRARQSSTHLTFMPPPDLASVR